MVYRTDAQCPTCGALERHRAAFLLLRDSIPHGQQVLHVAPDPMMVAWLVSLSTDYLNIDLYRPAMRRMDLMQLDLPDSCKTLVWCSHVLEHVHDDRRALREIYRVLRPGGLLVIQVPLRGELTDEDTSVRTEAERLERFLQEDHVRVYGRDVSQRIEDCGFACQILSTASLPMSDQIRYSLRAPLYREVFVCRRPA